MSALGCVNMLILLLGEGGLLLTLKVAIIAVLGLTKLGVHRGNHLLHLAVTELVEVLAAFNDLDFVQTLSLRLLSYGKLPWFFFLVAYDSKPLLGGVSSTNLHREDLSCWSARLLTEVNFLHVKVISNADLLLCANDCSQLGTHCGTIWTVYRKLITAEVTCLERLQAIQRDRPFSGDLSC